MSLENIIDKGRSQVILLCCGKYGKETSMTRTGIIIMRFPGHPGNTLSSHTLYGHTLSVWLVILCLVILCMVTLCLSGYTLSSHCLERYNTMNQEVSFRPSMD